MAANLHADCLFDCLNNFGHIFINHRLQVWRKHHINIITLKPQQANRKTSLHTNKLTNTHTHTTGAIATTAYTERKAAKKCEPTRTYAQGNLLGTIRRVEVQRIQTQQL